MKFVRKVYNACQSLTVTCLMIKFQPCSNPQGKHRSREKKTDIWFLGFFGAQFFFSIFDHLAKISVEYNTILNIKIAKVFFMWINRNIHLAKVFYVDKAFYIPHSTDTVSIWPVSVLGSSFSSKWVLSDIMDSRLLHCRKWNLTLKTFKLK